MQPCSRLLSDIAVLFHFYEGINLTVVCVVFPEPTEWCDGGWEAGVGAPPNGRVPAGNHRGHRSRQPHHRTSQTEGKGELPCLSNLRKLVRLPAESGTVYILNQLSEGNN